MIPCVAKVNVMFGPFGVSGACSCANVSKVNHTIQTENLLRRPAHAHICQHMHTHTHTHTHTYAQTNTKSAEAPDLEASGKILRHAARSCEVRDIVAVVDLSTFPYLAPSPTELR